MNVKKMLVATVLLACTVTALVALQATVPVSREGRLHVRSTLENLEPRGFGAPGYVRAGSYTGNKTMLVILLQFDGKDHAHGNTQAYYHHMLFNASNPASLTSFFTENSYGRLNLTGIVTPWIRSSRTMEFYGEDSGEFPNIDDKNGNIHEMAREAVQLADPIVDFSQFDENGDGFVDNLVIIHAGNGQESSGVANDIWSHRWNIPAPGELVDGVRASAYATLAENSPVGVFAHEYGHLLGLPDFYDYTYSGVVFAGTWAVMDSGSWNGIPAGTHPSHFISWSKMQMGFITPNETTSISMNEVKEVDIAPTTTQVLPANTTRVAIVNISAGVYYTIEVRNKTAGTFDASLPDQGVLVSFCNDSARDEVFFGRPGAVVVMNARPTVPSKDNAPFDLGAGENPRFQDTSRNIIIEVLSRNESTGAYRVRASYVQLRVSWFHVNGTDDWRTQAGNDYALSVALQNAGTTTLTGVDAVLSMDVAMDNVTIVNASSSYGTLLPGQAKNGTTDFLIQVGDVGATPMNFTLNVSRDGGAGVSIPLHVPFVVESNMPGFTLSSPVDGDRFNASDTILVHGEWDDDAGLLGAWVRHVSTSTNASSAWFPMDIRDDVNETMATIAIADLGNFTLQARVVDTSGNMNETSVTITIVDNVPPFMLLTINTMDGDPTGFAILGTSLVIVAVVFDNHQLDTVELSINGGPFLDVSAYQANITVTGGAGGLSYGTYPGYAFPWTPSIEGENLVVLRAMDASGNESYKTMRLTVLSWETIAYIAIIVLVLLVAFISVVAYAARKRKQKW